MTRYFRCIINWSHTANTFHINFSEEKNIIISQHNIGIEIIKIKTCIMEDNTYGYLNYPHINMASRSILIFKPHKYFLPFDSNFISDEKNFNN